MPQNLLILPRPSFLPVATLLTAMAAEDVPKEIPNAVSITS